MRSGQGGVTVISLLVWLYVVVLGALVFAFYWQAARGRRD
jgi:Flp pilus assembly protein TadB